VEAQRERGKVKGGKSMSTKRERKSKGWESVAEGLCSGGSTKRERKSKMGESVTERLCVEEQPLLSFFFKSQRYQYK
jgi:hypothetical protein